MLPRYHIIIGLILASIFYFIFNTPLILSLVLFFSSFLVDVDHYIYYIFFKKSLNLIKAYNFFRESEKKWFKMPPEKRERYKRVIVYFHDIIFLSFILILSLASNVFLFIFIGFLVHLLVDLLEVYYYNEPLYSKTLQIYVYITNKTKKTFLSP